MNASDLIGFGTMLGGILGIFWLMWKSSAKTTARVIDVVERNAKSAEQLAAALRGVEKNLEVNTEVTKAGAKTMEAHKDLFTRFLAHGFISSKKRKMKSNDPK